MSNAVRFTSTPTIHTPGMVRWLEYHFTEEEREKKMRGWWPGAPDAAYKKLARGDYAVVDDGDTVVVHLEEPVILDVQVDDITV
jgi:hypothetical protein